MGLNLVRFSLIGKVFGIGWERVLGSREGEVLGEILSTYKI
jgi:hypothetical protein